MKVGLALCGGGVKGSYQFGAIKALKEMNYDFDIITGTSIGSINGMMVFQDDLENLGKIWDNISAESIVNLGKEFESFSFKNLLKQTDNMKLLMKDYVKNFGVDILPLKEMLKENIKYNYFIDNKKIFGVIVTTFPNFKKKEVILNNLSESLVYDYILASSSCFPFFPIHKINDASYIDGGYSDNLPIDFAFNLGSDVVFAIDLNSKITHKNHLNKDSNVHYIYPKIDLGSFLSFEKNIIKRNILLGYYDTLKYFNKYLGDLYVFEKEDFSKYDFLEKKVNHDLKAFLAFYKNSKIKSENKHYTEFKNLIYKNQINKLTDQQMLLKTIESLAYTLKIDFAKIYKLEDILKILVFKIKKITNGKDIKKIKAESKKNLFKDFTDTEIIIFLYDYKKLNNQIADDFIKDIFIYKKNIFLSTILLKIL